jgi:hypothetical protein
VNLIEDNLILQETRSRSEGEQKPGGSKPIFKSYQLLPSQTQWRSGTRSLWIDA